MRNRRLLINSFSNFFGRVAGALVNFITIPFYVRMLGAESYGVVGFVVSLQASLAILDFGLAVTVNREVARSEGTDPASLGNTVATLAWVYCLTALTVFGVLLVASPWLANHWLHLKELSPTIVEVCLMLAAAAIALRWPVALYSGVMQGAQKQVMANLISGGIGVVRAAGGLAALVSVAPRLEVFFGWQVVSAAAELLIARHFAWRCLPAGSFQAGRFDPAVLAGVWRFAAGFGTVAAVGVFVANLDRLLVARLLPLDQLGVLSMLYAAAGILTLCGTAISVAAFPRLVNSCRASDRRTELASELAASVRLVEALVMPGFLVFAFFPQSLLMVWTGASVLPEASENILRLLALGAAINALGSPFYMTVIADGAVNWLLCANLVALALLLPLYWFGLPRFGLPLAAAGWCLLTTILLFASVLRCRCLVELPRVKAAQIGYWLAVALLFAAVAKLSAHLGAKPWANVGLGGALAFVSLAGTREARGMILVRIRRK
ncbi:MAG: oligosaccharide flippase family protein [Verrucomicrobiota bacterium]